MGDLVADINGAMMRHPPTNLLTNLSLLLQDRVKSGVLNQGQGIALIAKLDAALTQLDKGNENRWYEPASGFHVPN